MQCGFPPQNLIITKTTDTSFPETAKKLIFKYYPGHIYLFIDAMFPVPKKAVIIKNT